MKTFWIEWDDEGDNHRVICETIIINSLGALVCLNEEGVMIRAYAPGQWKMFWETNNA